MIARFILSFSLSLVATAANGAEASATDLLDSALLQYRSVSGWRTTTALRTKNLRQTVLVFQPNGDVTRTFRRSELRKMADSDAAPPLQVIVSALDNVWVLEPKQSLAIRCDFRKNRIPSRQEPVQKFDLSELSSTTVSESTVGGKRFLILSRVLTEKGKQVVRLRGVDPYYLAFGLAISTGSSYGFDAHEYQYVIDPTTKYLYGWRIVDDRAVAVAEERYQSVEKVDGLTPEMFRPPSGMKEVTATSNSELAKLLGIQVNGD